MVSMSGKEIGKHSWSLGKFLGNFCLNKVLLWETFLAKEHRDLDIKGILDTYPEMT